MKLSIILTFCDKDYHYINDFLKDIKNKVKIEHEILLVDNRINNKEELPDKELYDKVLVFSNKSNFGRHKAVFEVTGDRIWFIDADDEIYEIDESFEEYLGGEEEYIQFLYLDYKEQFFANGNCSLWNKWLKTDVCKEKFLKFKDLPIVFHDDYLMISALKTYKSVQKKIYVYRNDRSLCYSDGLKDSREVLRSFSGLKYLREELAATDNFGFWFYRAISDAFWFCYNSVREIDKEFAFNVVFSCIRFTDFIEVMKVMFPEINDDNNRIAVEIYERWEKFQKKIHK